MAIAAARDPRDLSTDAIRDRLRRDGAILEAGDVAETATP
jgi:hypothetical protein